MNPGRLLAIGFVVASMLNCMADSFPADQLTGVWRMTKTYSIGDELAAEKAQGRLSVTMVFLGGNRCKATFNNVWLKKESTHIFDFAYSNGEICFTKMDGRENKYLRDRLFGMLRASRFTLVKNDADSFEMRYADIQTLSKNWANGGDWSVEYLPDGHLKATTTVALPGGRTFKKIENHPPMVFRRIDASDWGPAQAYTVLAFGREEGNDFTYIFKLRLKDGGNDTLIPEALKRELKIYVVEDYAESFSDVDVSSLYVDFDAGKVVNGIVEGRASVVKINVVSFDYSPQTRIGKISAAFDRDQLQVARSYIERNIATLVRDKNIALITGEVPAEATVRIEDQKVKEDGVLEVVFKAVD